MPRFLTTRFKQSSTCVALSFLCVSNLSAEALFKGTVTLPPGAQELKILRHESPAPAHVPPVNGESVSVTLLPNGTATFELSVAPSTTTEFEFVGSSVLRQRFPWPQPSGVLAPQALFRLQPGATSTGTLSHNSVPITTALLGPILPVTEEDTTLFNTPPLFSTATPEGIYKLQGLHPNITYRVYVDAPGYEQSERLFLAGQPFEFTLVPSTALLSGTVIGERSSTPLPNRLVRVQSLLTPFQRTLQTDETGTFQFERLPAGDFHLVAYESGSTLPVFPTVISLSKDQQFLDLSVPAFEHVVLSGEVLNNETREPLSGVTIHMGDQFANTDASGRFVVPRYTSPWPIEPLLTHPEFEYRLADQSNGNNVSIVFKQTGEIADLRYRMQRRRQLVMQSPTGTLSSGKVVYAQLEQAILRETTLQEGTTQHLLPISARGKWLAYGVTESASEVTPITTTEFGDQDSTKTLQLEFHQGATLTGTLEFIPPKESETPRGSLQLRHQDVPFFESIVNETGSFEFPKLPPLTEFTLHVFREDGEEWLTPETITFQPGDSLVRTLQVQPGFLLTGTLLNQEQLPVPEAEIQLFGQTSSGVEKTLRTTSNSQGVFEFAHIAPMGTLDIRHPLYEPLTHRFELQQDETLSLRLRSKPSITLQLTADSELLSTGNAHLLQLNTRLLGEGQSHPFGEVINTLHESGATQYRFVPAQEGDFIVAYGTGDSWAVSSAISWRLGTAETTINLSVPQRSTLRVTSSAITQQNSLEWSLELVNTTIPEHVAKLEYTNPRWSSGSLEFTSLPHGWYYLTAFHPEFGARTVANINLDSPSQNLTLEMEAARYDIEGLLLDSDSKPLASATLELYSGETGTPLDSTTSSALGSFEFLLLNRESAYQLVVTLPGRREVIDLSPWNDPALLRSVVYELPRECLYLVAPPPGAATAGVPYFLQHETQAHQHTLFAEDFAKPITLREGTYLLSRGEERAGTLKVPPCTRQKDAPIGITPNWIP
jgi:hypothetical protein